MLLLPTLQKPKFNDLRTRVSAEIPPCWVFISLSEKSLDLMYEDTPLKAYRIGISKNPPSCLEHSLGSPWGIHRICERIGDGEPIGMVFESRKPIAHHAILSHADFQFITTRILRLEGLEAGINQGKNAEGQCCDTLERHVYIHGTPFGDKIGSSFTRGCFVLEDSAMLELYDQLQPGCLVYIERQICVTK